MNFARINIPVIFKNKNKTEIKELINAKIYNEKYKEIAIKYYVYEECQIDLALEYNVDRKTIYRILNKVKKEL